MNNSEFTKRIIDDLNDLERRKVIKKAIQNGFTVDGFSRKPYDAPIIAIKNCLNIKKRNKFQYEIILEAMCELSDEDGACEIFKYVKLWMEDENSHNQIESMLKENDDNNNEKCNEENLEDQNLVDIEAEQAKYKVKIEELEKELQGVRERVKQQKQTIQENKIEISNLKQDIARLEKECKQRQILNESLEEDIAKLSKEKEDVVTELEKKKYEISELKKSIDALQLFKYNAPKILCILKQKKSVEIPGFDINTIHKWDDEIKENILKEEYTKIWLVHRGFTYDKISDIKDTFEKEKIKEFNNYNKMYETITDGGI